MVVYAPVSARARVSLCMRCRRDTSTAIRTRSCTSTTTRARAIGCGQCARRRVARACARLVLDSCQLKLRCSPDGYLAMRLDRLWG
eukprot:1082995-Pleurochrysis_carterae.AAC.1